MIVIDDPLTDDPLFDDRVVDPAIVDGPLPRPDPCAAALLVFSSGTTGSPKAVVHSIDSLAEIAKSVISSMAITADDRFGDLSSFQFIAAHTTLVVSLLAGCSISSGDVAEIGLSGLGDWLTRESVTVVRVQVALARSVAHASDLRSTSLRLMTLAGETVFGEDLARLRSVLPKAAVLQCRYGSTEAQGLMTADFGPHDAIAAGPVVFPINDAVRVVDDSGRHVENPEVGTEGELIASLRLAVGYWKRPKATADAFFESDGTRWFSTRDRVEVVATGMVRVLGRSDSRVKVRGHNVDLSAVEGALMQHRDVRSCVVVDRRSPTGAVALVGFFQPEKGRLPGARMLRDFLRLELPEAMIPSRFVPLERFPSTPSGKVDRNALRASTSDVSLTENHAGKDGTGEDGAGQAGARQDRAEADSQFVERRLAPRDQLTIALAERISELLGLTSIGVHDDFFDLGMDSLTALELVAWIPTRFHVEVRVADLVRHPTVTQLLKQIVQHHPTSKRRAVFSVAGDRGCRHAAVFVPGAGDSIVSMLGLARHLGETAEVFVAQAPGVEGDLGGLRSVSQFAERVVDELRRLGVLECDSLIVGGHSFGGIVAHEIVYQIERTGGVVDRLIVLDTAPPKPIPHVPVVRTLHRKVEAWRLDHAEARRVKRLVAEDPVREGLRVKKGIVYNQSLRVLNRHRANLCNARILVLAAEHSHHDHRDWEQEWGRLTVSDVEVVSTPGTHADMHAEPHVESLAAIVRTTLP
jgi:non-ribosomal peptide synthetase component E (peptide arylation enzyme)/thioesterase domain-containing protein/aryl carrier-like protein